MENSDNGTELVVDQETNTQPDDIVAEDSEVKEGSLQPTDNDEFELEIDDEGEPEQTPETKPDYEKARKAFKEREAKRKAKEQEEEERKQLIDRINKLESDKAASKKPTLESCDYDEELFDTKLSEYYQGLQSKPSQSSESESKQTKNVDPEIEIKANNLENEIRKKLPAYDDIKVDLAMRFANEGHDPDAIMNDIKSLCHYAGVDSAKAVVALAKVPNAYEKLKDVAGNPVAASSFLGKVANQVKLAKAKKVDSVPEPNINTGGAIDNTASAVNKLKEQWHKSGSASDYRKLQEARKQLKGKK